MNDPFYYSSNPGRHCNVRGSTLHRKKSKKAMENLPARYDVKIKVGENGKWFFQEVRI